MPTRPATLVLAAGLTGLVEANGLSMGFHEGWGQAADQLEALARTL